MPAPATFVIAGGGLAAAKAAEALREEGFDGAIVLVGREPHLPYERPPLSKAYLQSGGEREKIFVHDAGWYRDHAVDLRTGVTVTDIDRAAHQVTLSDGERLRYDKLLLATGARPRRLTVPGHDRDNVLYLRTVDDSDRLRATLSGAGRIVVVGAGWIGLETAAAARAAGVEVTVVEQERQPLLGALGPEIGAVFAGLHREHGVDLRLGAGLAAVTESGVRLADGTHLDADAVVVGIGAGDVANAYHPRLGGHLRVEHWANALNQPAVAARAMLGRQAAYDELPYFYTDQYDLGMEYVGHVPPGHAHDVVIRGDLAKREFLAFWLRNDVVIAAMNVNIWDQTDELKALVQAASPLDRAALADPATPLRRLIRP
ncbi:NAD(P)/FAD-dependent oxidoreductase [Nonomuraea angiospora]